MRHRRLAASAVMTVVIIGSAALAPGLVRLVVLQPARDLLIFQRELDPWSQPAAIERHRPVPDATEILAADADAGHDLDLSMDVWIPPLVPAPAVLLLHGSSPRGRRLGFNMLLAERLRQAGWLVLTPDARGFGGSGSPEDPDDPAAWAVSGDLARLIAHARHHPHGDGSVAAVGHSLGASQLLQLDDLAAPLTAIALLGPARDSAGDSISWWQRVRFSSDRRIAAILPPEVTRQDAVRGDLLRFAADRATAFGATPILLMDGEREGAELIAVLRGAAARIGPNATHLTIPGSHHYCGAYQLPWPAEVVYLRPAVFDRCFESLSGFLSVAAGTARQDRPEAP